MSYQKYKSQFSGHLVNARLLMVRCISENKLALMTDEEIEKEINERYIAI